MGRTLTPSGGNNGGQVNLVVPELQRRGLFRREYDGSMLRGHLGLGWPRNRFARSARAGAEREA